MGILFSEQPQEEFSVFEIPPLEKHFESSEDTYKYCSQLDAYKLDVTEFGLSHNTYSEEAMESLAEIIQECPNINTANLSHIFAEWDEMSSPRILDILAKTLLGFRELRELDLSNNFLVQQSMDTIGFLLENTSTLKTLKLDFNPLGTEGSLALSEALKNAKELKLHALSMEKCNIGDKGAVAISNAFEDMRSLREINFSWNDIKKQGIVSLCRGLAFNEKIQILKVEGNYINDPCAYSALAKVSRGLKYLSILACGDACLGNSGIKGILSSLGSSDHLLELHIEYNDVDQNDIGEDLIALILKHKALEIIDISGYDFSIETIERIKETAGRNDRDLKIIYEDKDNCSTSDFPPLDNNDSVVGGIYLDENT